MSASRKMELYTTSEYVDALVSDDESVFKCKGKDFLIFNNPASAKYDAQWLVDFYKKEGKHVKRPTVYRIRLERVR